MSIEKLREWFGPNPLVPSDGGRAWVEAALREFDKVSNELERERIRLAACGVVALANTRASAVKARDFPPDYMSASCGDVARAVDEQMALREQVESLSNQKVEE